jgi:hypothetical protein
MMTGWLRRTVIARSFLLFSVLDKEHGCECWHKPHWMINFSKVRYLKADIRDLCAHVLVTALSCDIVSAGGRRLPVLDLPRLTGALRCETSSD